MFFRLCNRLVLFQYYINDTLQKYLNNFYTTYLNNILIFSKNKLEYKLYIKKILNKFQDIWL